MRIREVRKTTLALALWFLIPRQMMPVTMGNRTAIATKLAVVYFPF